jgi:hypothetical protein
MRVEVGAKVELLWEIVILAKKFWVNNSDMPVPATVRCAAAGTGC